MIDLFCGGGSFLLPLPAPCGALRCGLLRTEPLRRFALLVSAHSGAGR